MPPDDTIRIQHLIQAAETVQDDLPVLVQARQEPSS